MLDSTDLYVMLKVASLGGQGDWSQGRLAAEIGVSPSTVNRALRRAEHVSLFHPGRKTVSMPQLLEALVHGARYFVAPERGGEVRGRPTAWAAAPLNAEITASENLPPVWPDPLGETRGLALEPLHPSASTAAARDRRFYEVLALVDSLRTGDARERNLAKKLLEDLLMCGETTR